MSVRLIPAKCQTTHKPFYLTFEHREDGWYATQSSALATDGQAAGGSAICSPVFIARGIEVCPHCSHQSFFPCGKCSGFVCCLPGKHKVVCPHCDAQTGTAGEPLVEACLYEDLA